MKKFLKCLIGCTIYALGLIVFLQPQAIAPGGFSGLGIIANHLLGIPVGTVMICLNIPLAVIGFIKLGRQFMLWTIASIVYSSALINILEPYITLQTDPLLAAVYGGVLLGLGLGMVFSVDSSTGGTDIITRIIRIYRPNMSLGQIMVMLDVFVIGLSIIMFHSLDSGLYAFIAIYISSKMIDRVIEGPDLAKLVYIVSDKHQEIADAVSEKLVRGSTFLHGTGSYTGAERKVLMCAVRRHQLHELKTIASEIDQDSFMILTDVREVLGFGFKHGGNKYGL